MEKLKKENGRNFCLLLYPEDSTHVKALEKIKSNYDYAYILHDKDVTEDGEIKKSHWHVVINVGKNARWNTAVADELGITSNYVEKCCKLNAALQYLIHYNQPDKHHYDLSEVHGNLKTRLKIEINKEDKTEDERVDKLIDFINESGYLTVTEFAKYCATNGYWDVFRRSGVIFCKILEEHNRTYGMIQAEEINTNALEDDVY